MTTTVGQLMDSLTIGDIVTASVVIGIISVVLLVISGGKR